MSRPKHIYCQIEPKFGQIYAGSIGSITLDELFDEDAPDFSTVTIYKVPNKSGSLFGRTLEEIEKGNIKLCRTTPRGRYVVSQSSNELLKTPCEGEIVDHLGGSVSFAPDYEPDSRYRLKYDDLLQSAKTQKSILQPALKAVYTPDVAA